MRLVAATPAPLSLPGEIEVASVSISLDELRDVVGRIAVPRALGTPKNEAVRHVLVEQRGEVEAFSEPPGGTATEHDPGSGGPTR